MRVVVVTKDKTDYARQVTDYLHDFEHETKHQLEVLDPESPAGVDFCKAYDIMILPTIIAITEAGEVENSWTGLPLPTISEVSYYVQ